MAAILREALVDTLAFVYTTSVVDNLAFIDTTALVDILAFVYRQPFRNLASTLKDARQFLTTSTVKASFDTALNVSSTVAASFDTALSASSTVEASFAVLWTPPSRTDHGPSRGILVEFSRKTRRYDLRFSKSAFVDKTCFVDTTCTLIRRPSSMKPAASIRPAL